MKRQNKTGAAVKLSAVIVISSMMLGACAKTVQNQEIPAATYMGGNDTITGVCKDLDSAGASHVDTFQKWVADFADSAGKNAQLQDAWSDPKELKADVGKLYGRLGAES